jgi:hypothetical protein
MPPDMRLAPALSALLISVVSASSAGAQRTFNTDTRCGAFLQAVGAEDQSAIQAGRSYIMGVMEERDAEHVASGQGDMMGAVDENGRISLMSALVTYCDRDPQRSLRSAAVQAYDDARAMLGQMGRPR